MTSHPQTNCSSETVNTKHRSIKKDTAIVKKKETLSQPQNVNTITIQLPREGINTTQPIQSPDKWITLKDLLIAYAWPILIVFLVLLFYRHLSTVLKHLAECVKNLDEVSIGEWKLKSKQGQATFPTPAPAADAVLPGNAAPQPANLSKIINKILSTLWKYQKAFQDFSKRWTFTIGTFTPEYPEFFAAMRELASRGLVTQDPKTMQFMLTDIGILYCKQNEAHLTEPPFEFK